MVGSSSKDSLNFVTIDLGSLKGDLTLMMITLEEREK
jgi:hypothetical protein